MARVAVVIASVALAVSAAGAHHEGGGWVGQTDLTFDATIPCAAACPYWTDPVTQDPDASCREHPTSVPGSWDDHRFTVPEELDGRVPRLLRFVLHAEVDFDGFICRVLNAGTPEERWEEAAALAMPLCGGCGHCRHAVGHVEPAGCMESAAILVQPGEVYVLRAYNWSDPTGSAAGWYDWEVAA